VQFVSDGMSYMPLRELWFDIIVLNVHAPSENTVMMQKTILMRNYSRCFVYHFPKYNVKNLLGDFNKKNGERRYFQVHNWEREYTSG